MKKRSPLAQKLLAHIRAQGMLRAGERVGVAVSGGADSVAGLRLLLELRDDLGIVLSVVHLNHNIRGKESDADAKFVAALALQHKLELNSADADVPRAARERRQTLEEAAREQRYHFFGALLNRKQGAQSNIDKIATAHTMDDQAETVLMRILRGAGGSGLAAILPEIEEDKIVRPLLKIRRSEIEQYLRSAGQRWREDPSNQNIEHTRNRIRHELLPLLQRDFNPQIVPILAEAAEIAQADELHWRTLVNQALPAVFRSGSLNTQVLQELPVAMQRRLLRSAAAQCNLTLDFFHVEAVRRLAFESPTSKPKRIALPGGEAVLQKSNGAPRLSFRAARRMRHPATPALLIEEVTAPISKA